MVMLHDLRPPGTGTDGILSDLRPEVRLLECIASEEGGQAAHDQGPPLDWEGRWSAPLGFWMYVHGRGSPPRTGS